MNITSLNKQNYFAFQHLVSGSMGDVVRDETCVPAGIYDREKREAVGVALCWILGNLLDIRWFFIDEEYRGKGCGGMLLTELMHQAFSRPFLTAVCADLPPEEKGGAYYGFLQRYGFEFTERRGMTYALSVEDLAQCDFWKKKSVPPGVFSLQQVPDVLVKEFAAETRQKPDPTPLPYFSEWNKYDRQLSMVKIEGRKVKGVLLAEDAPEAAYLSAAQMLPGYGRAFSGLLYSAGEQAIRRFPPEKKIRLAALTDNTAELTERLTGLCETEPIIHAEFSFGRLRERKKENV